MRRLRLPVAVLVLGLASNAASLAGNGFRLYATANQHPPSGSTFSASAHGFSPQKALLSMYLARKPCRSTSASEAKRIGRFKSGGSYFLQTKKAFITHREHGQFYKAFTAHAGTTPEREYVCAYLTTKNSRGQYRITAAHASGKYTVTK